MMPSYLDRSVKYLKGVGPKRAELFEKLGIVTIRDLIYHLPRSYTDFSLTVPISEAPWDEPCAISAEVVKKERPAMIRRGMTIYRVLVTDGDSDMTVTIYNSQFTFDALKEGESCIFYGKVGGGLTRREMSSPLIISAAEEDKLRPNYPLTAGLTQNILRICLKNALTEAQNDDLEPLPKDVLAGLGVMGEGEALRSVHFPKSFEDAKNARRRLSLDELLTLRLGMMKLRERSRESTTYALENGDWTDFEKALPFKLTGAQKRSIAECAEDMAKSVPMNRLILGDVGSGKTAVAAACAYIAAKNGVQTFMMAPTEILASQHYGSLSSLLEPLGITVGLLTGSMGKKKKEEIYGRLKSGEISVAVGTHALLQQGVECKDLGLVITDEQHRFGVEQRAGLAKKGKNPHRLVMSATPIPRTLALMIYGELDISVLDELPAGRKKIETYAVTGKMRSRACGYIRAELDRGGQAYIVCPAVEESAMDLKNVTDYAEELKAGEFKGYRIGVLHGKLPSAEKEKIMKSFKDGELDILVCTTVVEVGVDVPNASVMLIENADRFGLSQLHQLRGRVGRGTRESFCILITDNLSEESRKRMRIFSSTSSGFEISEADLEMRGPGNFFGSEQHGLPPLKIADLGSDRELVETAQRLAEELSGRLTEPDCELLRQRVYRLFEGDVPTS